MGMLASCGGSETKEVLETLPHLVTKSDNYELSDEQRDKLNEAMAAGEIENFSTAADGVPTCVDMGLSVYWATFNVGANNPYEYGEYYAWAETEPKENYNARSYKYGISNFDKKTKYCFHEEEGVVDNKGILDLEDDAAHVNWGKGWRTPSKEEWEELNDTTKCTWEFLVLEAGFVGYKVISKITGNCILLPIAGHKAEKLTFFPMAGCYMTNEIYINTKPHLTSSSIHNENVFEFVCHAKNLPYKDRITTERAVFHDFMRTIGMQVRPVTTTISPQPSACMDIDKAALKRAKKDKELVQLQLKTYGVEFDETQGEGKSKEGNNNNPSNATAKNRVKENKRVTDASNAASLCKVEAVDMGLSVKWASCNVGASCVYESGEYYAWGETEPKDYYDWDTYKWYDAEKNQITKYCIDENEGTPDGKEVLDLEDDAAHVVMGGDWRTPTPEEWDELLDPKNCTWTWTKLNDVDGYEVVSQITGNSIFLPNVGTKFRAFEIEPYDATMYMGSALRGAKAKYSCDNSLDLDRKKPKKICAGRVVGLPVRAVMANDSQW